VATDAPTLPKTGSEASLTVAGAALSLLALGGFLLTTRRKAHND
ncbi:MAG: LPXTG cell wall anchor domain-containing protein, partial [Agrococcus casei]